MTTFDMNIEKFIMKKEGVAQNESYFASDVFAKLAQEAGLPIVHSDTQPADTGMIWFDPASNTAAARVLGEGGYKWFDGTAWVVFTTLTPAQIKTIQTRNVFIDNMTIIRNPAGALQAAGGGSFNPIVSGNTFSGFLDGKTYRAFIKALLPQNTGGVAPQTGSFASYASSGILVNFNDENLSRLSVAPTVNPYMTKLSPGTNGGITPYPSLATIEFTFTVGTAATQNEGGFYDFIQPTNSANNMRMYNVVSGNVVYFKGNSFALEALGYIDDNNGGYMPNMLNPLVPTSWHFEEIA